MNVSLSIWPSSCDEDRRGVRQCDGGMRNLGEFEMFVEYLRGTQVHRQPGKARWGREGKRSTTSRHTRTTLTTILSTSRCNGATLDTSNTRHYYIRPRHSRVLHKIGAAVGLRRH